MNCGVIDMNDINRTLNNVYDEWQKALNNNQIIKDNFSSMFRVGIPKEYGDCPTIMLVGQECLRCYEYKTQNWIIKYQLLQFDKKGIAGFDESINSSPFWRFFRALSFENKYFPVWNNLDKYHLVSNKGDERISKESAIALNAPYFNKKQSILQKEISLIKPEAIVFTIGNKEKYIASLASAFSIDINEIKNINPQNNIRLLIFQLYLMLKTLKLF